MRFKLLKYHLQVFIYFRYFFQLIIQIYLLIQQFHFKIL